MAASDREGVLARRLRELEEEDRRLRQSMKDVGRQLRKLERNAPDSYDSRTAPWSASSPSAAVASEELSPAPVPPVAPQRVASMPAHAEGAYAPRAPQQTSGKFASYFASGSFVETRPLGRERKQQRSRAILMILFVLLLGFLVYRVVF
ncbi:MAG: hypothetical protein J5I99_11390 [Verrucomicrobia bacterium]|nr:hypothetical protein [Kiritimatiellia bacterium]MCO6401814.1 hypothetical protein [Verrucomicrobiota bacterium]